MEEAQTSLSPQCICWGQCTYPPFRAESGLVGHTRVPVEAFAQILPGPLPSSLSPRSSMPPAPEALTRPLLPPLHCCLFSGPSRRARVPCSPSSVFSLQHTLPGGQLWVCPQSRHCPPSLLPRKQTLTHCWGQPRWTRGSWTPDCSLALEHAHCLFPQDCTLPSPPLPQMDQDSTSASPMTAHCWPSPAMSALHILRYCLRRLSSYLLTQLGSTHLRTAWPSH